MVMVSFSTETSALPLGAILDKMSPIFGLDDFKEVSKLSYCSSMYSKSVLAATTFPPMYTIIVSNLDWSKIGNSGARVFMVAPGSECLCTLYLSPRGFTRLRIESPTRKMFFLSVVIVCPSFDTVFLGILDCTRGVG